MVFLETALESKLNPLTVLGRNGQMGLSGFVNKFNADAELLDDLVSSFLSLQSMSSPGLTGGCRMTTGRQSRTRCETSSLSFGVGLPLSAEPVRQRERNWLI